STFDTTQAPAHGGPASGRSSGNGTVFYHALSQTGGDLVIDGQPGAESTYSALPIPPGYVFDNIVLRNNARVRIDGELTINDTLSILTGSILTHTQGNEAGLTVTAKRLYVDDTSAIDVTGRGYAGGKNSGNNESEGLTLGGLLGARFRSAGSYGGTGHRTDGQGTNPVYGTPENPIYLGSGGSRGYYGERGGNGGGRITVNASQSVEVDGALRADGATAGGSNGGDGSGGSILIRTALFKGMGRIGADGGSFQSCGGGGRVAVFYTYTGIPGNDFNGLRDVTAYGGQRGTDAGSAGSAGTVFFKRSDQTHGDVYVDAGRDATTVLSTQLTAAGFGKIVGLSADTITTDGGVTYTPNGLVGLEINPNLNQTQTYRVVSNTQTEITVDTAGKPSLTSVATVGSPYAAIYRYDNFTVRGGAYLALNDQIVVSDTMLLDENARVTHFDADPARPIPRLDLTVGTLRIAGTGWLEADGRGYPGGYNGHDPGFTAGYADGSTFRSGGSHGGLGAREEGTPTAVFDSLTDPADYGSGGSKGYYGEHGGDGGGCIVVRAGFMQVDGFVTVNGHSGQGSSAGSGAGGTINLSVGTLSGTGRIQANGGAYQVGGAGGRVAVRYTSLEMDTAFIEALGGQGSSNRIGGNGTLYLKGPGQQYGDLVIDGLATDTPHASTGFPGGYTFDNVTLRNKAQVFSDQNVQVRGALRLQSGSVLTHSLNSENGLRITAESIEVDADSSIDVSRKGYPGGRVLVYVNEGYTIGGVPGARMRSGGSYGGVGGYRDGGGTNPVYGIPSRPIYLGSGGSIGWYGERGGNGGGLVWLTADSVTIDGSILANGGTGGGSEAGSGSGGSVWIKAANVSGSGTIQANGGTYQLGGGGGRICIEYGTLGGSGHDFDGLRSVTVFGGIVSNQNYNGSAGTLLMKRTDQTSGDVYIDAGVDAATATHATTMTPVGYGRVQEVNGDTVTVQTNIEYWPNSLAGVEFNPNLNQDVTYTVLSNTSSTITLVTDGKPALSTITQAGDWYAAVYRFDNVYFRRGGYLSMADLLRVSGTLDLREWARLTHFDATGAFEPRLDVRATDLYVSADSTIEANARGYLAGRHNQGDTAGFTLGNLPGAAMRSGGSYGGTGGVLDGAGTNPVYGNPLDPAALGSGGACGYYGEAGGDGGGWILLRTQNAVLDGAISADGGAGGGSAAGGGSGGTVRIESGDIRGTGTVHANGGSNDPGGGGGRVLITYDSFGGPGEDFNGTQDITAFGERQGEARAGSAGTVVLRENGQTHGDLYIDDGSVEATASNWTPFQFVGFGTVTDLTEDTITTSGQVRMIPNGLAGIEINPNLEQDETYRIAGNTASTITVDLDGKSALTTVAAVGSPYAGVQRFDNVYFRRGGFLAMGDLLRVSGTLTVADYGVLTHFDATTTYEPRLDVWAGALTVDTTGSISVDGRGYLGGRHGHGDTSGLTLGNVPGATFRSGGSYGGLGRPHDGTPNPVYGDEFNPAALGSGGSCGYYGEAGGDGGGWISIWAGSALIDGLVSANGTNGSGSHAGGGSGGTINIVTPALGGAGQIRADGGGNQAGGGGGRVALHFNPGTSDVSAFSVTAAGGTGGGQAGTTTVLPGGVTSP
ncbi:MAG: hypothetical protein RBU21_01365, partial [FCB group bacterium]|nr:hypothetical protein [FCB group bacterium]